MEIIATISPKFDNTEAFKNAGATMIRINTAHFEYQWHEHIVKTSKLPVWLDLSGPKIRVSGLNEPMQVKTGDCLSFMVDGLVIIPVILSESEGPKMLRSTQHDKTIKLNDGRYVFKVIDEENNKYTTIAQNDCTLENRMGVSIADHEFPLSLTDRDKQFLKLAKDVALLGVSFVSSKKQIEHIKTLTNTKIAAKIETQKGFDNRVEIAEAADVLIVARGDLGSEIPIEKLCLYQKAIIKCTNKPVYVATGLLESMMNKNYPNRSEICDITNAILDGAAGLALTNETACGQYKTECVEELRRVCEVVC